MINKFRLSGLIIVCVIISFARAGAEESAAIGSAQIKSSETMIQNLLLICDRNTLRYTFSGGGENGINMLELTSGDKIINYTNCNGAKQCRMSGAVAISDLQSSVITAGVTGSDNRVEKEKIKLNIQGDETKVYLISSVPATVLTSPIVITEKGPDAAATETGSEQSATSSILQKEISVTPDKGPTIETKVVQNSYNNYTLNITAKDNAGVDFVEILENGVFMDVQICDKKPLCTFTKTIKDRKPGDYKYLIKCMNIKEGLSFQEENISFSE